MFLLVLQKYGRLVATIRLQIMRLQIIFFDIELYHILTFVSNREYRRI